MQLRGHSSILQSRRCAYMRGGRGVGEGGWTCVELVSYLGGSWRADCPELCKSQVCVGALVGREVCYT